MEPISFRRRRHAVRRCRRGLLTRTREVLTRTPTTLNELLRGLSDEWALSDEGPETWSPYQVVGHLAHIEESDWTLGRAASTGGVFVDRSSWCMTLFYSPRLKDRRYASPCRFTFSAVLCRPDGS